MKHIARTLTMAAFALAGLGAPVAMAGEDLKLENLPTKVQETVKAHVGNGKVDDIDKDTENGKVVYEVEYEANGKEYEMKVAADGKLLEKKED